MNRLPNRSVRWGRLLAPACLLALSGSWTGCSTLQSAVNGLSHWQENRTDCPPVDNACGNNNCEQPCVQLAAPQGYLSPGPVFGGEQILGTAGKTAVDRVLELKQELDHCQAEKQDLQQQLQLAQGTIEHQGVAIDAASKELQRALADYNKMRNGLSKWFTDLSELDAKFHETASEGDGLLERFERELQEILVECELKSSAREAKPLESRTPTAPDTDSKPSHGETIDDEADNDSPLEELLPPIIDKSPTDPVDPAQTPNRAVELSLPIEEGHPDGQDEPAMSLIPPRNRPS